MADPFRKIANAMDGATKSAPDRPKAPAAKADKTKVIGNAYASDVLKGPSKNPEVQAAIARGMAEQRAAEAKAAKKSKK